MIVYIIFIIGAFVYFWKPKWFFLFWIITQPIIVPIYFLFFPEKNSEIFNGLYFSFRNSLCYLSNILVLKSLVKGSYDKHILLKLLTPICILICYIIIQNLYVGFDIHGLYGHCRSIIFLFSPILLLCLDYRIRPKRNDLLAVCLFLILVQFVFSIFNMFGYRIYPVYEFTTFESHLISGTFERYNHMTNYLSTIYLLFAIDYIEGGKINRRPFFVISILVGLLIVLSGARMSLVLFALIFLYIVFDYVKQHFISLVLFFSILLVSWSYLHGNTSFVGEKADEASGMERNLIGIIDLVNSDDLTEGSTLALSFSLLFDRFENPFIGNGMAYRKTNFYYYKENRQESVFLVDARLAFTLVEYGIIGMFLFVQIVYRLMKIGYLNNNYLERSIFWLPLIYYFLFSLTDEGVFDVTFFSMLFVFYYSIKSIRKNEKSCSDCCNVQPIKSIERRN